MNESPVQPVLYRTRSPSPVEAVSYQAVTPSIAEYSTPQRKARATGYSRKAVHPKPSKKPPHPPRPRNDVLPAPDTPRRRCNTPLVAPSPLHAIDYGPIPGSPSYLEPVLSVPGGTDDLPLPEDTRSIERYAAFVEAVHTDECSMYQLDRSIFVVNGWKEMTMEAHGWYHLQRASLGTSIRIVCMCPEWKSKETCLHARFMMDYGQQKFPLDDGISDDPKGAILFSRFEDVLADDTYINHFSVPTQGERSTVRNRVVVEHRGDDEGGGTWKCTKDSTASSCSHITAARHALQRLLRGDPNATDRSVTDATPGVGISPRSAVGISESVSYNLLPPPIWSKISSDDALDQVPAVTLVRDLPAVLTLDPSSSCPCQSPRPMFDPSRPIERRKCIVYGLLDAVQITIQVQKCASCQHGHIGPDTSDLGLFNLNNRSLFALSLLDDYTAQFTRSETPFASWVASTSCRYQNFQSQIPFVHEKVFRSAWFSYARLMQLNNDMRCPRCGPTPKVTIWDGVTLSFSRKNLLSTLQPPTSIGDQSDTKPEIRLETGLQMLADRTLRKDICGILQGPTLELPRAPGAGTDAQPTVATVNMMDRISMIPDVTSRLEQMDSGLGNAFDKWFGTRFLFLNQKPPEVHCKLFLQLSAEESALQFINKSTLALLERFLRNPSIGQGHLMSRCPAIYNLIKHEFSQSQHLSLEAINILRWVYIRASLVQLRLEKYGYPRGATLGMINDWRKTGSCYGMPQIRKRPIYPSIPRDNAADLGGTDLRGEGCQKFYSTYGENRRTGGLMCVWCPHSICYGFHIIPFAEGRNDVFSAMYTHWDTAPEVVVYDFACALQPYCMTREPEFFGNTLFVIDAFHAKGHTKCGEASFITNYLNTNPDLITVNSSAGECGNSGILRIRKSVSYMSQDRAIIYSKIFLSIWNRQRIRKLEGLIR